MSNKIRNKMLSSTVNNVIKKQYKPLYKKPGFEEVYYKNQKIVVIVEDNRVGYLLYEIVNFLKKTGIYLNEFKVNDFIASGYNKVEVIFAEFSEFENFLYYKEDDKLQILAEVVITLMKNSYFLRDPSAIDISRFDSIAYFLSCFTKKKESRDETSSFLIEYIHYALSGGGRLETFYSEIETSDKLYDLSYFPYSTSAIMLCYKYFIDKSKGYALLEKFANTQIYSFFGPKLKKHNNFKAYLLDRSTIRSRFTLVEEKEDFAIYKGNIKIYQYSLSGEFVDFVKRVVISNSDLSIEKPNAIIFDTDLDFAGYVFEIKDYPEKISVLEGKFDTLAEIFSFISALVQFCQKYNNGSNSMRWVKGFDVSMLYYTINNEGNDKFLFKIRSVIDFYNLAFSDMYDVGKQLIKLLFNLLKDYVSKNYGEISSKEDILSKEEFRYLNPLLIHEFSKFMNGQKVQYKRVYKHIFCSYKSKLDVGVDDKFEYDPAKVKITFLHEAEKEYDFRYVGKYEKQLSTNRRLVLFEKPEDASKFKYTENQIMSNLTKIVDGGNVEAIKLSEVIYLEDIDADGMYKFIGYVTTPYYGEYMDISLLLKMSNKDIFNVAINFWIRQSYLQVPDEAVLYDTSSSKYYVDIFNKNFKAEPYRRNPGGILVIFEKFECLKKGGYYPELLDEAYEYVNNELTSYKKSIRGFLDVCDIDSHAIEQLKCYTNSLDSYCREHNVYFNSQKGHCPICEKEKFFLSQTFEQDYPVLYQDKLAVHYKVSDEFALKVYKPKGEHIDALESNIDYFVQRRIEKTDVDVCQDGFIPYKKAINASQKFVGYIYRLVDMENTNLIDIKSNKNLSNLSRVKACIKLIEQVKKLVFDGYVFALNPFGKVYLSKAHKKQVQILNVEFLQKGSDYGQTITWTVNYICQVIKSDSNIELPIPNLKIASKKVYLVRLEDLEEGLQRYSEALVYYCSLHRLYYTKEHLFCPKCCKENNLDSLKANIKIPRSRIMESKLLGEGGESTIYEYPLAKNMVAKVFKTDVINYSLKMTVLAHILGKKEALIRSNSDNKKKFSFILPQALLYDEEEKQIYGYIMRKVEGTSIASLRDKTQVKALGFTRKDVLEILITVAEGIEYLHGNGIYIGDLNGRNILFDKDKNVYFLDFDGMGVDEIANVFCTDGYIDPESQKNGKITMKDDYYSFAIQVFHYLTYTHPFNGILTVKEDGKVVSLDIIDKMERKISLLGNHGIKAPVVAEPWDWMTCNLLNSFLDTFEGNRRSPMINELKEQYDVLYSGGEEENLNQFIQIGPKFFARRTRLFSQETVEIISPFVGILANVEKDSLILKANDIEYVIEDEDSFDVKEVIFSDSQNLAFVLYVSDDLFVFKLNDDKSKQIYNGHFSEINNACANGETLYFTAVLEGENLICKLDFSGEEVKLEHIRLLPKQETKAFLAKSNSKFITVKQGDGEDEIYLNSKKFAQLPCQKEYCILCDSKYSKKWLIACKTSDCLHISLLGSSEEDFTTFECIVPNVNRINIKRICFNKGIIYIPDEGKLYIINAMDKDKKNKEMNCERIMTPESILCNFNSEGFSVITDNTFFDVIRKKS